MPVCKSRRQSKYKRRTYKKSKRKYSRRNRRYLGGMDGGGAESETRTTGTRVKGRLVSDVMRELKSRNAELERENAELERENAKLVQQLAAFSTSRKFTPEDVQKSRGKMKRTVQQSQQQRESELREAKDKAAAAAAEVKKLSSELQQVRDSRTGGATSMIQNPMFAAKGD